MLEVDRGSSEPRGVGDQLDDSVGNYKAQLRKGDARATSSGYWCCSYAGSDGETWDRLFRMLVPSDPVGVSTLPNSSGRSGLMESASLWSVPPLAECCGGHRAACAQ